MLALIDIEDFKSLDQEQIVLVDARGGADAYQRYLDGHIPGAIYLDLDKDLAAIPADTANGGRHPLPPAADFAALLGRSGITPQTHVIVYDDKAGAMAAARFWWMMRAIGHEQVQVLNGGLQAAKDAEIALNTTAEPAPVATVYPAPSGYKGTVDINEAGDAAGSTDRIVIDVREAARYLGQTEPIDLIAGHIPGAVNIPFALNMDTNNRFLSAEQLKNLYNDQLQGADTENVIVHCGSGVTACHTLLALEQAGLKGAKLYVGSWSEWSRRDLPIATGA